ncbi:hypothetical protein ACIQVK_03280 [Streptomyces sp. NPDC090493]|uniref:hypothetical protein n=1 Tax=Streptomyces sp. NPDC090493 TaxID=3365964 RepID=UPI0038073F0B
MIQQAYWSWVAPPSTRSSAIGEAVRYAVTRPAEVGVDGLVVDELVVRPTAQG